MLALIYEKLWTTADSEAIVPLRRSARPARGGAGRWSTAMNLVRALVQLGLHETEARFYLAALELGQAPVRDVAEKAGISRTNAYDVYSRLLEQRLVVQVAGPPGKALLVAAEPPEHIAGMFEERRRKLQALMPDLDSIHNRSATKPRVRYYQGLEGIQTVLDETLACRSKSLVGILSMRDLYEVPGREWMDDLVRRRIAAGVALRAIRSQVNDLHELWPQSDSDLRQLRYAPPDVVFTMTMYIYDDKVASISSQDENFAMTIESAEFASMQRHLFEALWSASSPAPRRAAAKIVDLRSRT